VGFEFMLKKNQRYMKNEGTAKKKIKSVWETQRYRRNRREKKEK
jgi:hypothetical protein